MCSVMTLKCVLWRLCVQLIIDTKMSFAANGLRTHLEHTTDTHTQTHMLTHTNTHIYIARINRIKHSKQGL